MVTLNQIQEAVESLETCGGDITAATDCVIRSIGELRRAWEELDGVAVKGRHTIDTLLGCMMAIEAIIGDNNNG